MDPWNPSKWTDDHLNSLIGQPENVSREFKSGKALAENGGNAKDKFVRDHLSREVSAFANSEGGVILFGMDESKKRPRVAIALDGIEIGAGNVITSMEQFHQILGDCIRPSLPGLNAKAVPLTGSLHGRFALVVYVPQGTTAYQARDYLYYSRSEFEAKAMPDHEIRLRMQRGRTPQARLELENCECVTAEQELQRRLKIKQRLEAQKAAGEVVLYGRAGNPTHEVLDAPKRDFDEYNFRLAVVNAGELTIRDFALDVGLVRELAVGSTAGAAQGNKVRFRFQETRTVSPETHLAETKLFPRDRARFPDRSWSRRVSAGSTLAPDATLAEWTIFLDDAAPISGEITNSDLLSALSSARTESGAVEPSEVPSMEK